MSDAAIGAMNLLGERLREARLKRNWNQSTAAEKAGLSVSSVKKVEAGSVNITIAAYVAMLDIFGQSTALDQLLAPGTDTIGDALQRDTRQRARSPHKDSSEWAF